MTSLLCWNCWIGYLEFRSLTQVLRSWISEVTLIFALLPLGAERDFSKLKIIKTDLRNSMNEKTLNHLLHVSINGKDPSEMGFVECARAFAGEKSRRLQLDDL